MLHPFKLSECRRIFATSIQTQCLFARFGVADMQQALIPNGALTEPASWSMHVMVERRWRATVASGAALDVVHSRCTLTSARAKLASMDMRATHLFTSSVHPNVWRHKAYSPTTLALTDHFLTTGMQIPENPRQYASLAPLNRPHLRLHALPMDLLRIQSP